MPYTIHACAAESLFDTLRDTIATQIDLVDASDCMIQAEDDCGNGPQLCFHHDSYSSDRGIVLLYDGETLEDVTRWGVKRIADRFVAVWAVSLGFDGAAVIRVG